jgi:hypothetical protein
MTDLRPLMAGAHDYIPRSRVRWTASAVHVQARVAFFLFFLFAMVTSFSFL